MSDCLISDFLSLITDWEIWDRVWKIVWKIRYKMEQDHSVRVHYQSNPPMAEIFFGNNIRLTSREQLHQILMAGNNDEEIIFPCIEEHGIDFPPVDFVNSIV